MSEFALSVLAALPYVMMIFLQFLQAVVMTPDYHTCRRHVLGCYVSSHWITCSNVIRQTWRQRRPSHVPLGVYVLNDIRFPRGVKL